MSFMTGKFNRCQEVFEDLLEKDNMTSKNVIDVFLGTLENYNDNLSDNSF